MNWRVMVGGLWSKLQCEEEVKLYLHLFIIYFNKNILLIFFYFIININCNIGRCSL